MDIYHVLNYLVIIFQRNVRNLEKFLYHEMTSWAKGTTANSLCSCTDYNLLFKGEEQVKICFTAYHKWIAKKECISGK